MASASSQPRVKRDPRPPTRPGTRSPDRRKTVRKPRRERDTRQTPGKPKLPTTTPSFPKQKRPKTVPFGKRPMLEFEPWNQPRRPFNIPWRRFAAPLALGGLIYDYLDQTPSREAHLEASGFSKCCDVNLPILNAVWGPVTGNIFVAGNTDICYGNELCGTGGQTVAAGGIDDIVIPAFPAAWSTQCQQLQYFYLGYSADGIRQTAGQKWQRVAANPNRPCGGGQLPAFYPPTPLKPPAVKIPFIRPPTLPQWLDPLPLPYSPTPHPHAPPLRSPRPRRTPRARPQVGRPDAVAPGVPSIDLGPSTSPGWHEKRPPTEKEKERKKRLTPSQSQKWLEMLVGGFTEADDVVSALYKTLPWKVRRWKGRDGVWRDRDINTKTRLERLFTTASNPNLKKAFDDLIKAHEAVQDQDLTDRLYGELGNQLKKQTKKLAEKGLYSGTTGLGSQRYNGTWDDAYELLKKKAAGEDKHARIVRRRKYNRETGVWETIETYAPRTQIPWMRQKSYYPRQARPGEAEYWELTKAERERNARTVDRYYYSGRRTRNNVYKGNDFPGYKSYREFYK